MIQTTWILVCDASKARIFEGTKKNQPWALLETIDHPESRLKDQDLVTDRPGRVQQSAVNGQGNGTLGKGSRSGMEPHITPKEAEHQQFARFLADVLAKGHRERSYDNLLIVANPQFLGILRGILTEQIKKLVKATVDKDYTSLPTKDLQERLSDVWMYL